MTDVIVGTDEGYFVSQKWMYLAEMIKDYNHNLELRWVPPANRGPEDRQKPYVVTSRDTNGRDYIVMYASELDQPEEIMTKIFHSDMKNGNVLDKVEARNRAHKLFELRNREEELAEQAELARWLVETKKTRPTFRDKNGDLVTVDEQLNRVDRKKHL